MRQARALKHLNKAEKAGGIQNGIGLTIRRCREKHLRQRIRKGRAVPVKKACERANVAGSRTMPRAG
jgi:hypothetical protein